MWFSYLVRSFFRWSTFCKLDTVWLPNCDKTTMETGISSTSKPCQCTVLVRSAHRLCYAVIEVHQRWPYCWWIDKCKTMTGSVSLTEKKLYSQTSRKKKPTNDAEHKKKMWKCLNRSVDERSAIVGSWREYTPIDFILHRLFGVYVCDYSLVSCWFGYWLRVGNVRIW